MAVLLHAWIGSPVEETWLFEIRHITKGAFWTPILREGEVVGIIEHTIGNSDGGFLYAPHCNHCAISNHSAAICLRMSATLNSTRGWSLLVKILGCFVLSRSVMLGSAESEHPRLDPLPQLVPVVHVTYVYNGD